MRTIALTQLTMVRPTTSSMATILVVLSLTACNGSDPSAADTPAAQAKNEHAGEENQAGEEGHEEGGGDRVKLTPEQIKAAGIGLAQAGPANVREHLPLYGVIAPNAERVRNVGARFPGVIRSVTKRVGDSVRQGETLAMVESNESLQTYSVVAPLTGVVTTRHANPGEQAGDKTLFTVADLSTVWVELSVFPRDIAKVRVGQAAHVKSADTGLSAEGKVVYVATFGSSSSQTLMARVLLDNADRKWPPGLYVTAELTIANTAVPLAVSSGALQTMEERTVVFVQSDEDTPAISEAANTYAYFLPSINAKLGLTDELILRAGASRTMTRPTLDDLTPTLTIGGTSVVERTASGDNPELKPFISTNFDASLEWYYAPLGSIAVAGFYKDTTNFIVRAAQLETIDTVADPAYRSFLVNRPRNAESAKIKGWTVGWTHALDMGLGLQANFTKVDSKAKLGSLGYFAVPGISDTANLVAFYEHGPLEARLAYNWRSKFLTNPGIPGTTLASTTDDYYQIDGRVGVLFGHGILASLEGVNLTKEKVTSYRQYKNQFAGYFDYGRQFWLKVSKNF